ncbi:MAG: hypothetical protein JOY59_07915 [Candidatus Eremiobacteraeota bacterium]|nr:hypothetical protein [Candidatus Eremiobacteraeota bacterium]
MIDYEALALWSQVIAAILFAIAIVWLFTHFLQPAIEAATAAKNAEIAANERRRDDARKAVGLARTALEEASRDAEAIRRRAEHDAQREADEIVAAAWDDAERLLRNAGAELDRSRIAARDQLRIELLEKALQLARSRARSQIDARENELLVARFLDQLQRGRAR